MQKLARAIQQEGFHLAAIYCADSSYINEPAKYISACITSIATMQQLCLPHINVLTKCDKYPDKKKLDRMLEVNPKDLLEDEEAFFSKQFFNLNKHLAEMIDSYSMVQYYSFDISNEESIDDCILHMDNVTQWGEY